MWIDVKGVRWLGIKPTRLRKLTPAQNIPELKVTQQDWPDEATGLSYTYIKLRFCSLDSTNKKILQK